jgi:hypothetical protein
MKTTTAEERKCVAYPRILKIRTAALSARCHNNLTKGTNNFIA